MPDVHDEADFDIPDTQAVLESLRFMTHMSKLVDVEYQAGEFRCNFVQGQGKLLLSYNKYIPLMNFT